MLSFLFEMEGDGQLDDEQRCVERSQHQVVPSRKSAPLAAEEVVQKSVHEVVEKHFARLYWCIRPSDDLQHVYTASAASVGGGINAKEVKLIPCRGSPNPHDLAALGLDHMQEHLLVAHVHCELQRVERQGEWRAFARLDCTSGVGAALWGYLLRDDVIVPASAAHSGDRF